MLKLTGRSSGKSILVNPVGIQKVYWNNSGSGYTGIINKNDQASVEVRESVDDVYLKIEAWHEKTRNAYR